MEVSCPSCRHPIRLNADVDTEDGAGLGSTIASVECPNCGQVPVSRSSEDTLSFVRGNAVKPDDVAHFQLIRTLGGGSFGTVWLARDRNLDREVALKLPAGRDPDLESLVHEAKTAATLHHPNIVSVHEVGSHGDQVFIASEYIEGLTLRDSLSAGKPTFQRSAEITRTIARALQHAHDQGVVHRDVKPANILMNGDGQPCITDFGLAKRLSAEQSISANGQVLGTARYMSPEQAVGNTRETDHRSDTYAVGVMLFEMLTGSLPFRGNIQAVLHQKTTEESPSPRTLEPSAPRDLETICLRCLAREPSRRYQSASEVADELDRFLAGEPIHARAISSAERLWRWCRRRPAIASLVSALFLSLTLGLLGVSVFWIRAEEVAEHNRRALYRSQMNLAAEYLAHGDLAGVAQTLEPFEPDDRTDLRGFEWYYHSRRQSLFSGYWNAGSPVADLAVSRNGMLIATLGSDRSIGVFSGEDGTPFRSLTADAGRPRAIAFSPANDQLAAGSTDGILRVWAPRQGEPLQKQIKHGPPIAFVGFSHAGGLLLSASIRGAARVWDVKSEELVAEIPTGEGVNKDVSLSPDGLSVAVAKEDGRVRVTEVESGSVLYQLRPNPGLEVLGWSPDSTSIAAGSYDGSVRVWSVSDATMTREIRTGQGKIGDLRFIDNRSLAIVGTAGQLLIVDGDTGRASFHAATHNLSDGVLDLSSDGRRLAVGSGDGSVKRISISSLARPVEFHHDNELRHVAFTDSDRKMVSVTGDGAISLWDLDDGVSRQIATVADGVRVCATQQNGSLIATSSAEGSVEIRDVADDGPPVTLDVSSAGIASMTFSPDGSRLVIGRRDGHVIGFSVDHWSSPLFDTSDVGDGINDVSFSPDGLTIVLACVDGSVRFADSTTGVVRANHMSLNSTPLVVAYCDGNRTIAVGTATGDLQFRDPETGKLLRVTKAHTSRINALAVFPDGATLVSAGRDRVLHLWDAATGE